MSCSVSSDSLHAPPLTVNMLIKKTFEELCYQMIDPPLEKYKIEVADTELLED